MFYWPVHSAPAFTNLYVRGSVNSVKQPLGVRYALQRTSLQGDTSGCDEPPADLKTKVPYWPGLFWPNGTLVLMSTGGSSQPDVQPVVDEKLPFGSSLVAGVTFLGL